MADVKIIAKSLGQLPDGSWLRPGEEAEVPADKVSRVWMERADGKPWPEEKPKAAKTLADADIEKLQAIANKPAADDAKVKDLQAKLDETQRLLEAAKEDAENHRRINEGLQAEIGVLTQQVDDLSAQSEGSGQQGGDVKKNKP